MSTSTLSADANRPGMYMDSVSGTSTSCTAGEPSSSLAAPWQRPVALVWVRQPEAGTKAEADEGDGPDFELLKAVYGLTQAECRIAELILQDLSPQECAQVLGVALATVRTQVRSLHAKCGCRRQTSLIRILEQFRKPV